MFLLANRITDEQYKELVGLICEFFCLLYIMYEAVSILKNMCLCGLPIPRKLRTIIEKWLNTMTSELEGKETNLRIGGDSDENRH